MPVSTTEPECVLPDVATVIANYRARTGSPEAVAFAREVVAGVAPRGATRARNLLWGCSRLAAWGQSVGYDLVPEVLLHQSTIERYVASALVHEPAGRRRTIRADLRFVARGIDGLTQPPDPTLIRRDGPKAPYNQATIDGYFSLARFQPTESRRRRLEGLLCLGLGAGLDGADLRYVRGTHIVERSGGLVVDVPGRRSRTVPVLRRYHACLLEVADFAGDRLVCGGSSTHRKNVTSSLVARLAGGEDLPRLDVSRLRATWLTEQAQRFAIAALLATSGLKRSSRLGDLVANVDAVDEATLVTLFGASR